MHKLNLRTIANSYEVMMKTFRCALRRGLLLFISIFLINNLSIAASAPKGDAAKGEAVFKANCASCHKIGGKMIGPWLKDVYKRWPDYDKLKDFVHHPSKYIGKDPYVIKIQGEMGGAVMAVGDLTDEQVENVLAYVNPDGAGPTDNTPGPKNSFQPVPGDNGYLKFLFFGVALMMIVIFYLAIRIRNTMPKNETPEDGNFGGKGGFNWGNFNARMYIPFLLLFFAGILWECQVHVPYFRPKAASSIGADIDRLFNNTLIVTAIVFFVTQILLFFYAYVYRERPGRKAYFYSHNNTVEFVWTIIPAIVLSFLVLDGFRTWNQANAKVDPNNSMVVEAFARQFDWTFRYPGADGKLGKTDFRQISGDNPLGIDFNDPASKDDFILSDTLRLPKGVNVDLRTRSQDVIHAPYLPHFRMQIYAQPGMDNHFSFMPTITTDEMRKSINNPNFNYELACNQLCGSGHWNMRRVVKIYTKDDYLRWAKGPHKTSFDTNNEGKKTASK